MIARRVVVRARDVVFFKGVIEANEGLAGVFAERAGDLVVTAPASRERDLDELLGDLCTEVLAVMMVGD